MHPQLLLYVIKFEYHKEVVLFNNLTSQVASVTQSKVVKKKLWMLLLLKWKLKKFKFYIHEITIYNPLKA